MQQRSSLYPAAFRAGGLICQGEWREKPAACFRSAIAIPRARRENKLGARELLVSYAVGRENLCWVYAGTSGRTNDSDPVLHVAGRPSGSTNPRVKFLICKEGERADGWRSKAADPSNVLSAGWLDKGRMHQASLGGDLRVAAYVPDAPQGIPNKMIEYLAAGSPAVSRFQGEVAVLSEAHACGRTHRAGEYETLYDELL